MRYKMTDMRKWAENVAERHDEVLRRSIIRMGENAQLPVASGGRMPIDTGTLRGSFTARVNNSVAGAGDASYLFAAMTAKPGDIIQQDWGGAAAAYAMRVNYGFVGEDSLGRYYNQPGRFFLEYALMAWDDIVMDVVKEVKAENE